MLVERFLEDSAAAWPDKVALVSGSRRLTYRQLDESAARVASGLRRVGIRRGDRVVIHLENSVEAVLVLFATLKAGGVFVLVNPATKAEKLAYILNDCQARVLVSDERAHGVVSDTLSRASGVTAAVFVAQANGIEPFAGVETLTFEALTNGHGGADAALPTDTIDLDLAALIYTSGSTGRPKGVMLTHGNIVAAATSIGTYLGHCSEDVIIDVLPLSFDYGLYQVFLAFRTGGRLILERSFVYPTVLLELLARERVTGLPIVPMIAALLLKHDLSAYDLSSLRRITNTGAVLPPAHIAALREQLPWVRIFSMYGLTECKRVSFLPPEELDARPTSVGKAMDNVEVYLVNEQGQRMDHGVGELVVRGANVMQGYWGAPEDTARALRPGAVPGEQVLYTSDIFRIDDDGFMYFVGRTDDVIKSRGQKVSPREIENVLHAAPGVSEAMVVGVPHPVLGEAVKAYVTLTGSRLVTEQELQWHCTKHLEDLLVPQSIEIVESLPRTTSGKIVRRPLPSPTSN